MVKGLRAQFGAPFVPCRSMVSGALIGDFVLTLALFLERWFHDAFSGLDKFFFSFFILFACLYSFIFIFRLVFLVDLYRIVLVFRVVITDCSLPVNFLLICVITPCYVIIFAMLCHLLYCKFI